MGADNEWVLYKVDMMTWLLRSVGDGRWEMWFMDCAGEVCCTEAQVEVGRRLLRCNLGWMRVPTVVDTECGVQVKMVAGS